MLNTILEETPHAFIAWLKTLPPDYDFRATYSLKKGWCSCCPLARYLQSKGNKDALVSGVSYGGCVYTERSPLPLWAHTFVRTFDAGTRYTARVALMLLERHNVGK